MLFVFHVCLSSYLVCSSQPLGLCFLVICHFPIWNPWSGVVFDCIDSLSLPSFLLSYNYLKYMYRLPDSKRLSN